jgi:transcriptional regulator with XRE-family HTH domain
MDIRHFVDKVSEMYKSAKPDTNLKLLRLKAGLSQRELAERSGIPVRTIQQYEQRQKNINKAGVEYLVVLSQVLFCDVESLLEKV